MDSRDSSSRVVSCDVGECGNGGTDRREFLRSAGCFGAMVALLPVFTTSGVGDGGERRYPVPASDSVNVDQAAQLIVVRADNHIYVFALSCPH